MNINDKDTWVYRWLVTTYAKPVRVLVCEATPNHISYIAHSGNDFYADTIHDKEAKLYETEEEAQSAVYQRKVEEAADKAIRVALEERYQGIVAEMFPLLKDVGVRVDSFYRMCIYAQLEKGESNVSSN